MATDAYWRWVNAGRPWAPAEPIKVIRDWAKRNGVSILGILGKEGTYDGAPGDHMRVSRPEDHTPFSFTAWPNPLPGYIVTAIDLANARAPGTNVTLGYRLEAMAKAGQLPFLKYLNHAGRHLDVRTGWRADSSSDTHVHMSIRTDWIYRQITFNPYETEKPEMEQTDRLIADTGFDGRRVGDVFVDVANLRNWLVSDPGTENVAPPAPSSRIGRLIALADGAGVDPVAVARELAGSAAFVDALAEAITNKLSGQITLAGTIDLDADGDQTP